MAAHEENDISDITFQFTGDDIFRHQIGNRFFQYFSAILDETGWLRAETASIVSASMIVYAATAALSGYLFDRFGARVVFPLGALCMGAGLMLCSASETLAGLTVAYGVLVGFSYSALGFIPHMAIVPRWFTGLDRAVLRRVGTSLLIERAPQEGGRVSTVGRPFASVG